MMELREAVAEASENDQLHEQMRTIDARLKQTQTEMDKLFGVSRAPQLDVKSQPAVALVCEISQITAPVPLPAVCVSSTGPMPLTATSTVCPVTTPHVTISDGGTCNHALPSDTAQHHHRDIRSQKFSDECVAHARLLTNRLLYLQNIRDSVKERL